jgi:ABC-type antimicrobial peptide transport system permease subunit
MPPSKMFRFLHKHVYLVGFAAIVCLVAVMTGSVTGAIAGYVMGVKLAVKWL